MPDPLMFPPTVKGLGKEFVVVSREDIQIALRALRNQAGWDQTKGFAAEAAEADATSERLGRILKYT